MLSRRLASRPSPVRCLVAVAGILVGFLVAGQAPARASMNNCDAPYPDGASFTMAPFLRLDSLTTDNEVSMENGWTGDSHARLRSRDYLNGIGPWEEFRLWCVDPVNGYYAIQSFPTGKYVSAELGWRGDDYGLLRARADTVGPWEKFKLIQGHAASPVWLNYGFNTASFKSVANGRYVSSELSWTGDRRGLLRTRPNQTTVGPWETFFMHWCVISCTG